MPIAPLPHQPGKCPHCGKPVKQPVPQRQFRGWFFTLLLAVLNIGLLIYIFVAPEKVKFLHGVVQTKKIIVPSRPCPADKSAPSESASARAADISTLERMAPSPEILPYIFGAEALGQCNNCIEAAVKEHHKKIVELEKSRTANMALIAAGEYEIGSADNSGDPDEHPRHKVYLDAFYIDKYEVTNEQFLKFMEERHSYYPEWAKPGGKYNLKTGKDDYYRKYGDQLRSAANPVVGVDWDGAAAYCKSRGKRLPTEAEWETAARGGVMTIFSFGDTAADADKYMWHEANSGGFAKPVGSKKPNSYGLYDMHGNVWEWVEDWYDPNYYMSSPAINPKGPYKGIDRVIRGGSWAFEALIGESANRGHYSPNKGNDDLGFRCAATPAKDI